MTTIGCISQNDSNNNSEEKGPTLTLIPSLRGVGVSEGYAISEISGDADVELPEGYWLPALVRIYNNPEATKRYIVIIGNSTLPADKTRYLSLSEEIKIVDLQEGVTKIVFIN